MTKELLPATGIGERPDARAHTLVEQLLTTKLLRVDGSKVHQV
jgi:hypothetical protein